MDSICINGRTPQCLFNASAEEIIAVEKVLPMENRRGADEQFQSWKEAIVTLPSKYLQRVTGERVRSPSIGTLAREIQPDLVTAMSALLLIHSS